MEQILLVYGLPKETFAVIMILYKNTRAMVCSPDYDTEFFDTVIGVWQEDILVPYMFIIGLDNVLQMSIGLIKENDFTLKMARSRWYPTETMTDADYTDDQMLLANTPAQAESLLYSLEQASGGIGLYVNAYKTEFMGFKKEGTISTGKPLKKVNKFT